MKPISLLLIAILVGFLFFGNRISFNSSDKEKLTEGESELQDTVLVIHMSDEVYKMGTSTTPREYVDTIITPDAEIKIYHGWNGLTGEWDPYVRYTETSDMQTFLYERYDLATQTWIGDLKMEIETLWIWQDGIYVRDQQNTTKSFWSQESQSWVETFYIETKGYSYWQETFSNGTLYELDPTSGKKKRLFSFNREDYGTRIVHFYVLWNTQTNTLESFYKTEDEVHRERMLYVWDYLNLNKEWVLLNEDKEEVERVERMLDAKRNEMDVNPIMVLFTRYLENLDYSYRSIKDKEIEHLNYYSGKI